MAELYIVAFLIVVLPVMGELCCGSISYGCSPVIGELHVMALLTQQCIAVLPIGDLILSWTVVFPQAMALLLVASSLCVVTVLTDLADSLVVPISLLL
jgi:hypothetical protein